MKSDIIVIGTGPAGLSAAINLATEGFSVFALDSKPNFGGQAFRSYKIENYPGFPNSISGRELIELFVNQAKRFNVNFVQNTVVNKMEPFQNGIKVITKSERDYNCKIVVIASGLSYRQLHVPGVHEFLGKGVTYGSVPNDAQNICIVGGANSAGQAALYASKKHAIVHLIVRESSLEAGMSQYLVDSILQDKNIKVHLNSQVAEVYGTYKMFSVKVNNGYSKTDIKADSLAIYIGAEPKTAWLKDHIVLTDKGYIATGFLGKPSFQTSMENVFACGDIRDTSVKRVAVAVGEGSSVAQQVKQVLIKK